MAYQAIPPTSGGGGNSLPEVVLARARALLGTTINFVGGNSFDGTYWYRTSVTGGSVTYSVTDRGGVLQLATGGGGSGQSAQVLPSGTTTIFIDNPKTSLWYIRSRFKTTSAVDPQAQLSFGMLTAAGGTPVIRLGLRGSQSTGFYSASFTDNAGTDQFTATTTVAYDTTAYHLFEIANNGTTMTFYIDGVSVASSAVTNMGTSPITPFLFVSNGTTAANRTMSADDLWFACAQQT